MYLAVWLWRSSCWSVLLAAAGAVNAGWNPAIEWLERAPQTFRKIDQRVRPLRAVIARFDEITERAGRLAQGVAQSTKIAASTRRE